MNRCLAGLVAAAVLFGMVACSGDEPNSHIFAVCDAVEGSMLDTGSDTFGGPTTDGQVQWAVEGCAVRTDMVFDVPGDDHCEYGDVRLISVGRPLGEMVGDNWDDLYIWNPNGVVPDFPAGTIIDVSSLPATVADSGLRGPDAELWIEDDRSAIYLVHGDQARKLPIDPTTEAANCA